MIPYKITEPKGSPKQILSYIKLLDAKTNHRLVGQNKSKCQTLKLENYDMTWKPPNLSTTWQTSKTTGPNLPKWPRNPSGPIWSVILLPPSPTHTTSKRKTYCHVSDYTVFSITQNASQNMQSEYLRIYHIYHQYLKEEEQKKIHTHSDSASVSA